MHIHHALESMPRGVPVALAIGAFDGIHLGHQHLFQQLRAAAIRLGGVSTVLTFDPHPDRVLRPQQDCLYLTSSGERAAILEDLGIDHLIVLRFDQELAQVPAEAFMAAVCGAMDLRELWVGPDARLGAGGRGTPEVLRAIGRELGFTVHEVERRHLGDQSVSSTAIRGMLAAGQVDDAARLLGRPFILTGEVVHGDHRGRTIGFPTANVAVSDDHLLPLDGVYACRVYLPGESAGRPAVTNVGVRPTFGTLRRTVEAHLIDWDGDIYSQVVRIAFLRRLRGEQKFSGVDALVTQIRADVATARELLRDDAPARVSSSTPP